MSVVTKEEINKLMDNWLTSIFNDETTVSFDKLKDKIITQLNFHQINLLVDDYERWL